MRYALLLALVAACANGTEPRRADTDTTAVPPTGTVTGTYTLRAWNAVPLPSLWGTGVDSAGVAYRNFVTAGQAIVSAGARTYSLTFTIRTDWRDSSHTEATYHESGTFTGDTVAGPILLSGSLKTATRAHDTLTVWLVNQNPSYSWVYVR